MIGNLQAEIRFLGRFMAGVTALDGLPICGRELRRVLGLDGFLECAQKRVVNGVEDALEVQVARKPATNRRPARNGVLFFIVRATDR